MANLDPVMTDGLVILGAAGIIIPLFALFRITPVVGFILIGLLVGPFGLGRMVYTEPWLAYVTITDPEGLEPFAQFGIVMLLFSIGLQLSFGRLWTMRKLVFGLGALELVIIGAFFAAFLSMLGQYWTGAVALGLALAMSSTALVLPLSGTRTPVGRAALSMLLFEGIALVPIIFVLGAMAPHAGEETSRGFVTTLWQGALVVIVMLALGRFALPRLFALAARTKSPELFLSATLLVVIGAALSTTMVGLSPIVGALLAGLLIAETEYHSEVEGIMEPFKGLALAVFLITVGMSIDLSTVWDNLGIIALALFLVLALKAAVTGVLLRMMGASRSTSAETGILMASPSEDTLIIISVAGAAMLIQPGTAQFWQIVTALGMTLTPVLAKLGAVAARRLEPTQQPLAVKHDGAGAPSIIVGCGRVGRLIAQMLDHHSRPYLAIDTDSEQVARSRREGYNVVFANAARLDTLERLGVGSAPAVILTMDEPVLAKRLVRKLRSTYPELPIIARARDSSHAAELYRAGASTAVPEALEAALQLSEAVLIDLGLPMGPVIATIHEKRDELRERIMQDGELSRKPKLRVGPE